jgi:hypothetical protein
MVTEALYKSWETLVLAVVVQFEENDSYEGFASAMPPNE